MIEIIVIAICLLVNSVLSCIEMAFVTVSKVQMKQLVKSGSKAAARILLLKQNPERTLSVLQIGITLVGAISAAVGGAGAEDALGPYLRNTFGLTEEHAELIAIAVIVGPLTYLSVVIGELVPKSLALRFPVRFALNAGIILVALDKIFAPFVYILEISTRFFTQFLFAKLRPENIFDPSRDLDLDPLSESHKQYVFNLIDINKKSVKDIMLPWEQAITVDYSEHHYKVLDKIKASRHTRMPVIKEGKVIGILYTKEFVSESEVSKIDWTELIRMVLFLKPNEPILNALKKFQQNKSHLAVIIHEEQPVGIVTVEDIFEEVVGEMVDEDDDPKKLLSANSRIRVMNLKKPDNIVR